MKKIISVVCLVLVVFNAYVTFPVWGSPNKINYSHGTYNSDGIYNCRGIYESDGLYASDGIYVSSFLVNCKGIYGSIFCYELFGVSYYAFNQSISHAVFAKIKERIFQILDGWLPSATLSSYNRLDWTTLDSNKRNKLINFILTLDTEHGLDETTTIEVFEKITGFRVPQLILPPDSDMIIMDNKSISKSTIREALKHYFAMEE